MSNSSSVTIYSAFLDDVSNIFLEAIASSFRATLLPWTLRVDVVLQATILAHVCSKLVSNKLWSLISDQQVWPTVMLDPQICKRIPNG